MTRRHGGRDQTPTIFLLVEGDSESDYFTMFKRKKSPLSLNIAVAKKHEAKNIMEYCTSYAKFHGVNVEQGDYVHIVIDLDEKTPEQISEIEGQFIKNGFELIFPTVPSNTGCYFISRIIQKHLCKKNWKKSLSN